MSGHASRAVHFVWVAVFLSTTPLVIAEEPQVPTLVRSTAPDWPQWRGPRRDGVSDETGLLPSWPSGGPKCSGEISGIGRGYSSPIVVNDTIYVTGDEDDDLIIRAFSLDGSRRWQTINGAAWKRSFPGARSACTYDDGKLYHMNAHGRVACLDAATGTELWAVEMLRRFQGKNITWGISESLLVDGDQVFVTPAGKKALMAALDKHTGATAWASPPIDEEQPSYASPVLIAVGQRSLLVNGGARYAFAVDTDSGELCWKMRHLDPKTTIVSTPILSNDRLVFTNASRDFGGMYGVRLVSAAADRAWTADLKVGHGGLVSVEGRLFGASSRGIAKGWLAIDPATGTPKHLADIPRGSVIYADGRYYCLTERGNMTLQELTKDGFRSVGSFELAKRKDAWAHPVLCKGRLFLRYHDTLYCYDVRS